MASLDRRENGTYSAVWWSKSQGRVRESLDTASKKEAQARLDALEHARKINRHDPWTQKWYDSDTLREIIITGRLEEIYQLGKTTKAPALQEASKRYIQFKTETPGEWDARTTIDNYTAKINQFVRHAGPSRPVDEIKDGDVAKFTRRADLSDFTIQSDIRIISSFLAWCAARGWRESSVGISGPSPQKDIPEFLYADELKKVCLYKIEKEMKQRGNPQWQEDHSQWWHPLYWILLARLGVRPSELLAVEVDHVRDGEILVRKGSQGKSQAARRRVPVIGVETRAALDVLTSPKFRQMDRLMASSDLLFGRESRASLKRASAEFREAVAAAVPEKKDFKMRDLRNTWAYWFLTRDRSKDPDFARYQLKRIMGHSTPKMSDYYMDSLPFDPDLVRLHRW